MFIEAPKIPRLFGIRTKKPNQFYYEPRYYNERKEKMGKRYAQIEKELELEKNKSELKSTLQEHWGSASKIRKLKKTFNTRIIIYTLILLGIAYWLLR